MKILPLFFDALSILLEVSFYLGPKNGFIQNDFCGGIYNIVLSQTQIDQEVFPSLYAIDQLDSNIFLG